jgi:flagellar hook-associated protein 2
MPTITASGSGSGLDIEGIIEKLTAAERAPTESRLNKQETRIQGSLTAYNTLKAQISEFRKTFASMGTLSTVANRTVTTSNSSLFSVSATSSAAISNTSVSVERLAAAQKLSSVGFASPATQVGAGTINITSGSNSFSVSIVAPTNNTLAGIRDSINRATDNISVTASILTVDDGTGTGTTVSKLILTSDKTGAANALKVTVSGDADGSDTDASGLSSFIYEAGGVNNRMSEITAAQDAWVKADGFDIYSSSNTVSGAIQGVTLNLLSASPGSGATVKVAYDRESIKTKIKDFVTGYNNFAATMGLLTNYDVAKKQSSLLTGDFVARTVEAGVKRIMNSPVTGASGDYNTLSSIGVTTKRDGTLDIDLTKLDTAVATNFDGVAEMLAGDNGVMKSLITAVDSYTSSNGLIASRVKTLNTSISDINDRRIRLDERIAAYQLRIRKTYTTLDQIIGQMKSTGDYVTQQMEIARAGLTKN